MPIKLKCPQCGKSISAPSKYAGRYGRCPGCNSRILIGDEKLSGVEFSEYLIDEIDEPQKTQTIECPYCSEEIKATAKKCKHCGDFLGTEFSSSRSADHPSVQTVEATGKKWKLIQLLGGCGIVVGILIIGVVFSDSDVDLMNYPLASLKVAIVILCVSTAVYTVGRVGAWWYHG